MPFRNFLILNKGHVKITHGTALVLMAKNRTRVSRGLFSRDPVYQQQVPRYPYLPLMKDYASVQTRPSWSVEF